MAETWRNWSGSLRFQPARIEIPRNEHALSNVVRRAAEEGRTVRVVGSGHSSMPLVETTDILVSLERFGGIESHDREAQEATLGAGTTLHDANAQVHKIGLAMPNLGDVDGQTVAGAFGTGTHGTGTRLRILSASLVGVRLVNADGGIQEFSHRDDPHFFQAARVSLGTLGIFTSLTLRLLPTYRLRRREWCWHIEDCMNHLEELMERNRHFDFYWYPRSDEAKLRLLNPAENEPDDLPDARLVKDEVGWWFEILPVRRHLEHKFEEMEYGLPTEAGPACFQEVRERIKQRHRRIVGWRVLYRTIASDDSFLSLAYGRPTATISLHQNAELPYREFFDDLEPIFRSYGGRPHWGKKHSLKAADLRLCYPSWDAFSATRERMDPDGRFLNPYLRELLGA